MVCCLTYIVVSTAIVGDITPADGVPKQEKSRREREAIDYMSKLLGGGQRGTLMHVHMRLFALMLLVV